MVVFKSVVAKFIFLGTCGGGWKNTFFDGSLDNCVDACLFLMCFLVVFVIDFFVVFHM